MSRPPTPEQVEAIRAALAESPTQMTMQLARRLGVPEVEVIRLLPDGRSVELDIGRWRELFEAFAELGPTPDLPATDLAGLTTLEVAGAVTATQAKAVLATLLERGGGDATAIAAEMGFEAMDTSALEAIVDEAIASQPDAWSKYLEGERKALGAIVGQVMKASKGQADGKLVNQIVERRAAAAK